MGMVLVNAFTGHVETMTTSVSWRSLHETEVSEFVNKPIHRLRPL